jgi:glycosyltransferase involved in cell wall biosynthesis
MTRQSVSRDSKTGLVSVVVPCHNQGRYLEEALQSVFSQTYPHIEIVVVDDGSDDATASIARGFDDRIRFMRQQNRGASAARNLGLSVCSGAYVQFLDADDKLEPNKILRQVEFLEHNRDTGIVYSDVRYFSDSDPDERTLGPYVLEEGKPWTPMLWAAPGTMLEKLIRRNVLAINSALMRRDAAATVGPWNESLCAVEDWEYWIRCAAAGIKFTYQDWPGTLSLVRLHPASTSTDLARVELGIHQMRAHLSRTLDDPKIRATIRSHLWRSRLQRFLRIITPWNPSPRG